MTCCSVDVNTTQLGEIVKDVPTCSTTGPGPGETEKTRASAMVMFKLNIIYYLFKAYFLLIQLTRVCRWSIYFLFNELEMHADCTFNAVKAKKNTTAYIGKL